MVATDETIIEAFIEIIERNIPVIDRWKAYSIAEDLATEVIRYKESWTDDATAQENQELRVEIEDEVATRKRVVNNLNRIVEQLQQATNLLIPEM